jgi:hypothetical protein
MIFCDFILLELYTEPKVGKKMQNYQIFTE